MVYRRSKRKSHWKEERYSRYWWKLTEKEREEQERLWQESRVILQTMYDELVLLGEPPSIDEPVHVIEYAVKIFDISSRAQDNLLHGGVECIPSDKKAAAEQFNKDIYFCGRHTPEDKRNDSRLGPVPYWNTTSKGEPITVNNIRFGLDIGLRESYSARKLMKLSKKKRVTVATIVPNSHGVVARPVASKWITEAIVEAGVHKFCVTAFESLNADLKALLA